MQYSLPSAHRLSRSPRVDSGFVQDLLPIILAEFQNRRTPTLDAFLAAGLVDGPHRPRVAEIARRLRISSRSLGAHLHEEGWVSARRILQGCLILRGSNYLCHTEATVQSVAGRVGLSGPHALRRLFKGYLGISPRVLLDPQQWRGVVRMFVESLERRPAGGRGPSAVTKNTFEDRNQPVDGPAASVPCGIRQLALPIERAVLWRPRCRPLP